jgi:hypothetical protein
VRRSLARKGRDRKGRGRNAGIAVAVALCAALIFFVARHGEHEAKWPQVPGTIQETRVVVEYWVPATLKVLPRPVWRADYRVTYNLGGREYASWTYSGIRNETKEFAESRVREALNSPGFSCRVKYNPARPEVSVAVCQ